MRMFLMQPANRAAPAKQPAIRAAPAIVPKIPMILMQTNKHKSADSILKKLKLKAPHVQYVFFDDAGCIEFFKQNKLTHYPNIIDKFNSFRSGAHKADLFRYYYLFINGGVFIDSDAMLEADVATIVQDYDFFSCDSSYHPGVVFQGFIGATKNNEIMRRALDDAYNTDANKLDADYHLFCRNLNAIVHHYTYPYKIKMYKEQINDDSSAKVVDDFGNTLLIHYYKNKIVPN